MRSILMKLTVDQLDDNNWHVTGRLNSGKVISEIFDHEPSEDEVAFRLGEGATSTYPDGLRRTE